MQNEDEQVDRQHPLLLLHPPATDHLTYLTLIEHFLLLPRKPSLNTREEVAAQYQEENNDNNNNDDTEFKSEYDKSHKPTESLTSTTKSPSFSLVTTFRLLHRILRTDTSLTASIGWDLVQILLPHVGRSYWDRKEEEEEKVADEAQACLLHVASYGNPREVVLKVGEGLWRLGRLGEGDGEGSGGEGEDDGSSSSNEDDDREGREGGVGGDGDDDGLNTNRQFTTLLSMLTILHQRIKTKRPSRFLSSSLQAIFAAYESEDKDGGVGTRRRRRRRRKGKDAACDIDLDERTAAVVTFVKSVSGVRRPRIPERETDWNNLNGVKGRNSKGDEEDGGQSQADRQHQQHEPDPEADMSEDLGDVASLEAKDTLSDSENSLQKRLLQSFVTHLLSRYILATEVSRAPKISDLKPRIGEGLGTSKRPIGLAWSLRLLEKLHSKRWGSISASLISTSRSDEKNYLLQQATAGEFGALAKDLDLTDDELKTAILESGNGNDDKDDSREVMEDGKVNGKSEKGELQQDLMKSDIDAPESVEDIPLCREGALFLLAMRATANILYGEKQQQKCKQENSGSTTNGDNNFKNEEKGNVGLAAYSKNDSVISLFPEHNHILKSMLPASGISGIGNEPAPVIDALCALGIVAFTNGSKPLIPGSESTCISTRSKFSTLYLSDFPDTADFQSYIQTLSLIAATNPDPSLRAIAHHLVTSILHSHPSASVRLLIIRDVLEHCPFQNLKESAVGWLKNEIINAAAVSGSEKVSGLGVGISDGGERKLEPLDTREGKAARVIAIAKDQEDDDKIENPEDVDEQTTNIFATPIALATTAPFLFPDLTDLSNDGTQKAASSSSLDPSSSSTTEVNAATAAANDSLHMSFVASTPLYIATINLLYLLLSARHLRDMVDTDSLLETYAVETKFLGPLERYCADKVPEGELGILSLTIARVNMVLENGRTKKARNF